jgi:hypothetical protein
MSEWDHRGDPEHLLARLGEHVEVALDGVAHAARERHLDRGLGVGVEAPVRVEELDDLGQEERIAAGLLVQSGDERLAALAPGRVLDELGHRRAREALQVQRAARVLAHDLAQDPARDGVARELGIPVGPQHQDRGGPQLSHEELQQQKR